MYRIIYLPEARLVPAYLDDVDYIFTTKADAKSVIRSNRVVYGNGDDTYRIYINSCTTGTNLVPTYLLEVVRV
jgi:hypothetical protein